MFLLMEPSLFGLFFQNVWTILDFLLIFKVDDENIESAMESENSVQNQDKVKYDVFISYSCTDHADSNWTIAFYKKLGCLEAECDVDVDMHATSLIKPQYTAKTLFSLLKV
ncbi:uncharacterized protein LOC143043598 isoform X2 [Mytilus galloprovincialis]